MAEFIRSGLIILMGMTVMAAGVLGYLLRAEAVRWQLALATCRGP